MSLMNYVDLIGNLNINPVPLEIGNGLSDAELLMEIQAKVNQIVDVGNSWANQTNKYTDEQIKIIQKEIDDLVVLLNNGNIIPDGSIALKKLNSTFLTDLQETILAYVHNTAKFVTFGLDKNGYFIAYIPDSWSDIIFSTDTDGRLCLDIPS